jgi:hypothetical protein
VIDISVPVLDGFAGGATVAPGTVSTQGAQGKLQVSVGTVLPLEQIRNAHLMLAGAQPRQD